jgi:hypothetical protein
MRAILLALLCGTSLLVADDKASMEEISQVFKKIEANYESWPHHTLGGETLEGGQGFEKHIWQSDDDSGLTRVEEILFSEHGESTTQFFLKGEKLLFVLDRSETTPMQENAPTTVVENRNYFADGKLIRQLRKEGTFAAGKKTDTASLPNKTIPLKEVEDGDGLYGGYSETARKIIDKLATANSEDDAAPARSSSTATAGEGWRMIKGTRSRNEKFALAWGIQGVSKVKGEADEDGDISVDPQTKKLTNYVVNLTRGAVLGKTSGNHFGDKAEYGHLGTEAVWSNDARFVAQFCTGKWETFDAKIYSLLEDSGLSKGVDLHAAASKAAFEHLKDSPQLKKFKKDDFAITLRDAAITYRGTSAYIQVGVLGQIPKNEDDDSFFGCTVTFKLEAGKDEAAPVLTWSSTEADPE